MSISRCCLVVFVLTGLEWSSWNAISRGMLPSYFSAPQQIQEQNSQNGQVFISHLIFMGSLQVRVWVPYAEA